MHIYKPIFLIQKQDQHAHLLDEQFLPYHGHNSFREKYFSGLTKRIAREEKAKMEGNSPDCRSAGSTHHAKKHQTDNQ